MATQPIVQRDRLHDQGLGSWYFLTGAGTPARECGAMGGARVPLPVSDLTFCRWKWTVGLGPFPPWSLLCGNRLDHTKLKTWWNTSLVPRQLYRKLPSFVLFKGWLTLQYYWPQSAFKSKLFLCQLFCLGIDSEYVWEVFFWRHIKNTDGNTKLSYFLRDQHSYD